MRGQASVITLHLAPASELRLSTYSGYACQWLMFNLIKQVNPELSSKLHGVKGIAPYSVTPLMRLNGGFVFKRSSGGFRLWIRFVIFNNGDPRWVECSRALLEAIPNNPDIIFGDCRLVLHEVEFKLVDLPKLWEESTPIYRFSMDFITPTRLAMTAREMNTLIGMNTGKPLWAPARYILYPDPERILSQLTNLWLEFTGLKPVNVEKYRVWLRLGGVVCSGFPSCIRTVTLRPYEKSIGFLGRANFVIPQDELNNPLYARFTDTLLKMAELTNVGDERTAGLGVVRYRAYEPAASQ